MKLPGFLSDAFEPEPLYAEIDIMGILSANLAHAAWRIGDVFFGPLDLQELLPSYLPSKNLVELISKPVTDDEEWEEINAIMEGRGLPLLDTETQGPLYFAPALGMTSSQLAAFTRMSTKQQLEIVVAVSEAILGVDPADTIDEPRAISVDQEFWKAFLDAPVEKVDPEEMPPRIVFNDCVAEIFSLHRIYVRFGGKSSVLSKIDLSSLVANDMEYANDVRNDGMRTAIRKVFFGPFGSR
jgi:hypothetical protein